MLQDYEYTMAGTPKEGQSDAGQTRIGYVIAFCDEQAIAWMDRNWGRYVADTRIISKVPYIRQR